MLQKYVTEAASEKRSPVRHQIHRVLEGMAGIPGCESVGLMD